MKNTSQFRMDVTAFGAVADGITCNTEAIQRAIDAAGETGGTVTFPPGVFVTGSLRLRSGITVELQTGATLLGSPDLKDYPILTHVDGDRTGRHLLYADHCENLTFCGGGRIDGNGPAFWEPTMVDPDAPASADPQLCRVVVREKDPVRRRLTWIRTDNARRPSPMIVLESCRNVRIHDVTLGNSGGWNVHLHHCDFVWVRGVKLDSNLIGPNNDGFDIMGCSDVMISDCYISCCDDAVCLKTEKNGRPCERITVTNCIIRTRCVAFKCGWSDSFADFRQLTFSNCVVFETHRAVGLYSLEGATIEDVTISNIVCNTQLPIASPMPIHLDLRKRRADSKLGRIRNIAVSNFVARTDGRIVLTAADGGTLEDIVLRDVQMVYPAVENAALHRDRKSSQHSQGNLEAKGANAAIVAENVDGLLIDGLLVRWPESQDPAWVPPFKAANGEADLLKGEELYPSAIPAMALLWKRNVKNLTLDVRPQSVGLNAPDILG